jgi:hypothetical protein
MPPVTNSQASYADRYTTDQFITIFPTPGCGFKTKKAQCKHCSSAPKSWNTTTILKPHLDYCRGFKKWEKTNGTDSASAKKKQHSMTDFFELKDSTAEELFALAVYTSTASFSLFDTPEWKAFYTKLGFTAPHRNVLAGRLLTSCYDKIKAVVHSVADAASHI